MLENLTEQQTTQLNHLILPKWNQYIPHIPEPKQQAFLLYDGLDGFYGGAVGGMKSDTLLMAALQYVDIPGYNAVLFRDTYANLVLPEGLLNRAHEWLSNTDAEWSGDKKKFTFPPGATLSFSYLDGPLDHFNHLSAAYQFIGLDECVAIRENQALYMFSRLRKRSTESYMHDLISIYGYDEETANYYADIYRSLPLRFRCASNPPTREQLAKGSWVKRRYVDPETREDRAFFPAKLSDNPHVNQEEYIKPLMQLDPVTRKQLLDGDWMVRVTGRMFDRSWFPIVDQAPIEARKVRFYDPAHTEPSQKNKNPDWFAGVKMSKSATGLIFIEDVKRWQKTPLKSKQAVLQQTQVDGRSTEIFIEREPSAGTNLIDDYIRLLAGFIAKGVTTGNKSKYERAQAFASYAEAGNVYLVNGPWIEPFLDELEVFPDGEHDDQVDAASGAFNQLNGIGEVNIRWI